MAQEVSRQAFLRTAGLLAAGTLLSGCRTRVTAGPATAASATSATTTTASTVTAAPRDWTVLADAIGGHVVLPSEGDFTTAKAIFNSRFDGSAPVAVVVPTSPDDVRQALTFATQNGLKVAARNGGHSYIGDSAATDAMVIDLRQLPTGINYDDATQLATISAGAELSSVQLALNGHGRSIPTGSCPTVGVSGLTLGGGLGADARRWGLTCDALVSATVVLPSGETVTASQDEHDDLYWALRGGGGGHFGVATSFTFRTFPVADRDVVTLVFPEGSAAQAILGWHEWIGATDRANWSMVNLTAADTGLRCSIVSATSAGNGASVASNLIAAVGTAPVGNTIRTLNHMDFVDYFSGGDAATIPRAVVAGSDVVGEMTSTAADSIVAATSARSQDMGSATVVIESLTGAVRDVDTGGSAFPWRRQDACLQWYTEPSSDSVDAAKSWLASAHHTLGTTSVGGYVNYVEAGDPPARYFADNVPRLTTVRQKYDPNQVMYSSVRY